VDPKSAATFLKNKATRKLLRDIHTQIYTLGVRAFESKDLDEFRERRGEVKALKWVLGQIDNLIPEDNEETDDGMNNE
jgi:hypothetical protein